MRQDFRIGLSSWSYGWAVGVKGYPLPERALDPFALVERAAALGAEVVQLADNMPWAALSERELASLADRAGEAGIALEAGTRGLAEENLLQTLRAAATLGAKLVRTLPHDGADRPDLSEAKRRVARVLPFFEAQGVTLAIENHDFYPSAWLRELVSSFETPLLGVCLDPVNNLGQGESESEVLSILGPRAVNFHCKDYAIRRKPSMLGFDVEGAPSGEGFLNLSRLSALLPPGLSWVVELWTPWQSSLEETLRLEGEWAEKSVKKLIRFRES